MASVQNAAPPASFDAAFRRLKDLVGQDNTRSFDSTTLKDVWDTVRQMSVSSSSEDLSEDFIGFNLS